MHYVHKMYILCLLVSTDPSLTLENVSTMTATVKLEDDELGREILNVPYSKLDEINQQSSTAAQKREGLIRYFLNYS